MFLAANMLDVREAQRNHVRAQILDRLVLTSAKWEVNFFDFSRVVALC